jgi:hypothetical protein
VVRYVSKMGFDLDIVLKASPSPTTLCPAGGHPWTRFTTGPGMAAHSVSSLVFHYL